ncbi:MAG: hypothetical protein KJ645_07345, partial [Planctomycetes bacterium]|nr:hypothetical protein [Planctomycetota bacterium]
RSEVETQFLSHVEAVLARNEVPVVLVYMLGRAQEMLKLLVQEGFTVALENRTYDMSKIYEDLGVEFGDYERFDPEDYGGRVLLFPPHLWKSPVVKNIRNSHSIAMTGWAMDGRQQSWYNSDIAFPVSDHADFDDLIRYIELSGAKKVSLIHGFEEFAEHIKHMGIETELVGGLVS